MHSLVVIVLHKLLQLLDVAHGLEVVLHVLQQGQVVCNISSKDESSCP